MSTATHPSPPTIAVGAVSSSLQQLDPHQVHQLLHAGRAILIDVRDADEHARERIPGSRLVPLSLLNPHHLAEWLNPGQLLVFHCRSGQRSADACRLAALLADRGVSIASMTGGIEAWKKLALPVQRDNRAPRLNLMRQVQLLIGLLVLLGAALAWFVHPAFVMVPAFFGAGLTFAGATGTCALASLLAAMPWNKTPSSGASCPV